MNTVNIIPMLTLANTATPFVLPPWNQCTSDKVFKEVNEGVEPELNYVQAACSNTPDMTSWLDVGLQGRQQKCKLVLCNSSNLDTHNIGFSSIMPCWLPHFDLLYRYMSQCAELPL